LHSQKTWIRSLLIINLLTLLSVLLNFDGLLLRLGTHLGGSPDSAALALWHLWWPQYGVWQSDPLIINAYSGAPYLVNHLRYMPILQSWLFAPLRVIGGPVLAFNLILLLSQVATQVTLFSFFRTKAVPGLAAGVGATAFVLSPWYVATITHADLIVAGLWTLPVALLAWDAWLRRPTWGRTVGVVVALYAAVLCGVQHVAWIVGLWLPYAILTGRAVWRAGADDERLIALREQLSLMILLGLIPALVYPLPTIVRALQGGEPAFANAVIPPPPSLTSFVGPLRRSGPLIWLFGVVALLFAQPARKVVCWAILGGLYLLVAVGLLPEPLRMIAGALAMPYQPLYDREVFFGLALIVLLIFGLLAWRDVWERVGGTVWVWVAGAAALALIAAAAPSTFNPLERHPVQAPAIYDQIAAEPEDYLLLAYPFGLLNTQDGEALGENAALSQYAVWHHKRTLGGIAPHYEPTVHDRFREVPFLFPEALEPGDYADAADALGVAVREWRVGYVVVYPDLLAADALDTIAVLAQESDALCPATVQDGLVIYRARWHPAGCESSES
jgi:hypothetical protein